MAATSVTAQASASSSGRPRQGSERRAVLAFDLASAVPADATVTNVTLTVNLSRTISDAVTVDLHRLTADWGEGASAAGGQEGRGADAADGDATWTHRFFQTETWANPGGDFQAAASASADFPATAGEVTFESTQDLVADVQAWLNDPSSNFAGAVGSGLRARRCRSTRRA